MILTTAKEIGIMADYENNLNNTEETAGGAPQPTESTQNQPISVPQPEQTDAASETAKQESPASSSYASPQGSSYTEPSQQSTAYYAGGNAQPQQTQAQQQAYNPQPQQTAQQQYQAQQQQQTYRAQQPFQQATQQQYYAPQNGAQVPPYGMPQQPVEQKASVGLAILSFFIPIAGLIIFLTKKNDRPKTAKVSGICALVSFILNIVIGVIGGVIGGVAATKIAENPDQLDSYISEAIGDNSDNLVQGDELGNFVCDVTDVSKTTDANGKPAIIVTYSFKNNSSTAIAFDNALYTIALQNDDALSKTLLGTSDDSALTDVSLTQPGETSKIMRAYTLQDETSNITFEIYDNTDENNMYYLEYEFSLTN